MEIRMAQARDIPGMLELLKQVGQVHHEIRPDIFRPGALKYDGKALETLLADPERPIFVAVTGDFVAGYCFCVHKEFQDHPIFESRRELYIDDLCVEEKLRGRGIAKALYAHAEAYGRKLGFDAITLNVWSGNDGAMAFYEKSGMSPRNIHMEKKLC